MTGVIYARYSSDSQREESIEGQLRECMAYAERSGITIIGNYIDRAMSARTADRPDFQRMINDSEKHLFDVILVWKLDRFSRDRYDSATYKHILKKNGVKVISATENISDSPEGILLESLLEGLSEYYSAELSVKIQRGQMENAMKGKNNGGTVPLGLRKGPDGVMELDPITAPIVQEIFQRYDKGESMTDIVASLNERGIRTAKGLPFRIGSLGTVLKNRKYIGEYRYGKIVIPDKLPVIIDVELFDRVQRRMEINRHAPARAKADEEYLLTTKLFCGHCGRMLAGESGRSRNGEVHYYYKCGGAKRKQGCTLKAVKKRWIERTVVTATIARVLHDDVINRIADALVAYQDKESTLLPSLKQQLRECEKSIQNMLNAIEAGIITPSTKQRLQELESRREELNVSILQEQLQKPKFTKEQIVAWISRFKYGDPDDLEYQKQIINTFVNSVYVYDDRLVMTYNYKDGTETISLDAVHQAFGSDLSSDAPRITSVARLRFFFFPCPVPPKVLHYSRKIHQRSGSFNMFRKQFHASMLYGVAFLRWVLTGVVIGAVCGVIGALFAMAVEGVTHLRQHHTFLLYLLPLGGLAIAGLYRLMKLPLSLGTDEIITTVRTQGHVPVLMAPAIFLSTVITHLLGGSAGREGAALQLGGSIGAAVGDLTHPKSDSRRIFELCGMAALFAALFGTPLTAAVFVIEIIEVGRINYRAFLPCVASAVTAALVAKFVGAPEEPWFLASGLEQVTAVSALQACGVGIACALVAILFCTVMHVCGKTFRKVVPNDFLRIALGGVVVVLMSLMLGTQDYNGGGMHVIFAALAGEAFPWAFLLKLLFTAVTLSAGFKGGEIVPSFFVGATMGCTVAGLIGLSPALGAALGLVGVFCGVTNAPLAAILLSIELFGAEYLPLFGVVAAVSFMLSGHFSLYHAQLFAEPKLGHEE